MLTELSIVNEFHEVFKIGKPPKKLTLLPSKEYQLRYDLGKEELDEYLEACQNNDLKEIADSLGDQLYILCGTILKHGLQYKIYDVFEEIHRSNMSKLDENGKPIFREDGKVLKGKNFFKPDLKKVLDV
jgi:predicted HAD superfamily Cof-like phosphohydrolase